MAASQLQAELDGDEFNSYLRASGARNGWLSVVKGASADGMHGVHLQGICFMLSLTAGGNGAFNIKNYTCVSKEQTNVFLCFLLWWLYFSFIDGVDGK